MNSPRASSSACFSSTVEMFDFGLQVCPWKPKENDARVEEAPVEDQLAEIAVDNEQNALLVPGDGKDILIGKDHAGSRGRRPKPHGQADEDGQSAGNRRSGRTEFHSVVASDRAPFGGFGETSSPVTIALV
jgi:hypothetical protein